MPIVLLPPTPLADRCGLSRSTLAKQRLRGEGPRFVKIGAAVRYREDDVQAWLTAQPRRRSTSEAAANE